jgi:exonuclease VII small subunit
MSRKKSTSRNLQKAEFRVAGLKAIDPNIAFDENCNLQNLTQLIDQFHNMLKKYNDSMAVIDSSRTKLDEMEKTISKISDKMLAGVGFKYGKDSNEYELAGGVKQSERVRKSRLTRLKNSAEKTADDNMGTA